MSLIFPAIKFRQTTISMYLAAVPVGQLERFSVDIWNPNSVVRRRGYQRAPEEDRIKKIAKYFEREGAILPIAGLANVREKGKIVFSKGKVIIPDGVDIWVVDMQHRLKGLLEAREQKHIKDSFPFPVVITEGLTQAEEAAQFYIINTKAKKMDVALTRRLLIERDMIKDIADARPWEIGAIGATIDLNTKLSNRNPWYQALRQPNEGKNVLYIATEKSFVTSLRQLFLPGKYRNTHAAAKKIAAFWWAIKANVPEAFSEPRKYLIQKTPGIYAFNFFIAPAILSRNREKDFIRALRGLKSLGPQFWKRSNKDGARRFGTGMGGYSNLADYIREKL